MAVGKTNAFDEDIPEEKGGERTSRPRYPYNKSESRSRSRVVGRRTRPDDNGAEGRG